MSDEKAEIKLLLERLLKRHGELLSTLEKRPSFARIDAGDVELLLDAAIAITQLSSTRPAPVAMPGITKQSSGCFDKGGNELFVGDRVRYRNEGSHTLKEYWNPEYEVIFNAPSYTLRHVGGGKDGGAHLFMLKNGGGNGMLELISSGAREVLRDSGTADIRAVSDNGKRWRLVPIDGDWEMQPVGHITVGEARSVCRQVESAIAERGALLSNLQSAWTALRMIREAVETLGPVGSIPSDEHVACHIAPTFEAEAEVLVSGIVKLAASASESLRHANGERITRKDLNDAYRSGQENGRLAAHCLDGVPKPYEGESDVVRKLSVTPLEWHECRSWGGTGKLIAFDCFGGEFARFDITCQRPEDIENFKQIWQKNYEERILAVIDLRRADDAS